MFTCNKCNKDFDFKYLLKKHENRKTACNTKENIIIVHNNKIENIKKNINMKLQKSLEIKKKCLFCDNDFLNKSNLIKHINNVCLEKKRLEDLIKNIENDKNKFIEENNKIFEQKIKDDEVKSLREMVMKLIDKQTNANTQNIVVNNNNTNNGIINNNLFLNINSFGKENLSHITLNDYKKYLNGFFPGFIQFIEKIHFDENTPENHNICITNINSKYMYVYENNEWKLKEKNDVIDNIMTKKYNLLGEKCEELEESKEISKKIIDNFEEFCEHYNSKEAQKNTKKEALLMIYNNKDKIASKPKILESRVSKKKLIN